MYGVKMDFNYQLDAQHARDNYDEVKAIYPKQVKEAHDLIVNYLRRYDKPQMLVFQGQAEDKKFHLGDLRIALQLISSILYARDSGVEVDAFTLDKHCRAYLYLPFASIDGGKQD